MESRENMEKFDLSKVCRACLSNKPKLRHVDEDLDFIKIFENHTSVKLNEVKLPVTFCENCIDKVEIWNNFHEMCVESHKKIKTLLSNPDNAITKGSLNDGVEHQNINNSPNAIDENIMIKKVFIGNDELIKMLRDGLKHELDQVDDCETITSSEEIEFKCDTCCTNFQTDEILAKHNEKFHAALACSICNEEFNNLGSLTEHLRKIHQDVKQDVSRKFKCDRCGKSYAARINLQIHMYSHTGVKPFKCEYCERTFTKHNTLKTHLTIHTGVRNHLCSECGKSFTSHVLLNRHKAGHTGLKPFKCKICPGSFASSGDLNIHIRSHTGEKPYLCSTCGKSFRRSTHLNIHRRIHTGEKPYGCTACGKGFAQSGDLRAHERTHTGERPYLCTICHKRFSQGSGLTTHLKKHSKQLFSCEICKKKFSLARSLARHALIHSGNHINMD